MNRYFLNFGVIVATMIAAAPALAGGLNLTVEGIRNTKGNIIVLVFDSKTAFE